MPGWFAGFTNHSDMNGVDWVVVGGESGRNARPMHPDWALSLRDQCQAAGVPYFFKQWGEYLPICQEPAPARVADRLDWHHGRDSVVLQRDGRIEFAFPEGAMTCVRMGKREAGRQLDGRTWDEYPACAPR